MGDWMCVTTCRALYKRVSMNWRYLMFELSYRCEKPLPFSKQFSLYAAVTSGVVQPPKLTHLAVISSMPRR